MSRSRSRVLVVGMGGIGGPAALALARAGVGTIGLCDDDDVERSNLHRQILFADRDAEARVPKVDAAAEALRAIAPAVELRIHRKRLLPEGAMDLVRQYNVVLEGADNFATKFLAADACALAGIRIVQASAVRWVGTVLAAGPQGRPCYRCLFEDIPSEGGMGCAEAGVMGPVVGIIAAIQADLALAMIDEVPVEGQLVTFDGRTDELRRRPIAARADCRLCGRRPRIRQIEPRAYVAPSV
ncbi:MAG: HesA/MoeB/ThiF family protein [Myxococcota bacterium]|nr:HesA/MoeB/ThiF family protein [Myxococcota bacterium]